VQRAGNDRDVMIRIPAAPGFETGVATERLLELMTQVQPDPRMESSEVIGPAVGDELRDTAGLAALVAFGAVALYIMFRFTGKFAVGAGLSLVHDVLVTLGVVLALGVTFDLPAFAAVLAIIGYSINDTIVIFDRIRENLRLLRNATPEEAINLSLNQTLERTIYMSVTTLLTLVALLIFGGPALRGFATTMTVGVVVGTYSSIYVAASLLLTLEVDRSSLLIPESVDDAERP
jgi:preprotein translocase subunit SecF